MRISRGILSTDNKSEAAHFDPGAKNQTIRYYYRGAAHYARGGLSDMGSIAMIAMTALGTLFSIYLTILKPFVIGATCVWYLTSAVLMTALMLFSVGLAKLAFSKNK
jgi:uncharacterized membrane protein